MNNLTHIAFTWSLSFNPHIRIHMEKRGNLDIAFVQSLVIRHTPDIWPLNNWNYLTCWIIVLRSTSGTKLNEVSCSRLCVLRIQYTVQEDISRHILYRTPNPARGLISAPGKASSPYVTTGSICGPIKNMPWNILFIASQCMLYNVCIAQYVTELSCDWSVEAIGWHTRYKSDVQKTLYQSDITHNMRYIRPIYMYIYCPVLSQSINPNFLEWPLKQSYLKAKSFK